MYSRTTHTTLLAKLRDPSDISAWDEFCERYGDLILAFARGQGLQAADCDDVLQDVLLILTGSMPRFVYDPEKGKFRSFLKTVTLRAVFKKFRQKRGGEEQEPDEEALEALEGDPAAGARWEEEWRQYHLRSAMKRIATEFNESDQAAFRLYALEQRSAADTAQAVGLSVDGVYQTKSRIVARLSALIELQVKEEG